MDPSEIEDTRRWINRARAQQRKKVSYMQRSAKNGDNQGWHSERTKPYISVGDPVELDLIAQRGSQRQGRIRATSLMTTLTGSKSQKPIQMATKSERPRLLPPPFAELQQQISLGNTRIKACRAGTDVLGRGQEDAPEHAFVPFSPRSYHMPPSDTMSDGRSTAPSVPGSDMGTCRPFSSRFASSVSSTPPARRSAQSSRPSRQHMYAREQQPLTPLPPRGLPPSQRSSVGHGGSNSNTDNLRRFRDSSKRSPRSKLGSTWGTAISAAGSNMETPRRMQTTGVDMSVTTLMAQSSLFGTSATVTRTSQSAKTLGGTGGNKALGREDFLFPSMKAPLAKSTGARRGASDPDDAAQYSVIRDLTCMHEHPFLAPAEQLQHYCMSFRQKQSELDERLQSSLAQMEQQRIESYQSKLRAALHNRKFVLTDKLPLANELKVMRLKAERDLVLRRLHAARKSTWLQPLAQTVTKLGERRPLTPEVYMLELLKAKIKAGVVIDEDNLFEMMELLEREDFDQLSVQQLLNFVRKKSHVPLDRYLQWMRLHNIELAEEIKNAELPSPPSRLAPDEAASTDTRSGVDGAESNAVHSTDPAETDIAGANGEHTSAVADADTAEATDLSRASQRGRRKRRSKEKGRGAGDEEILKALVMQDPDLGSLMTN